MLSRLQEHLEAIYGLNHAERVQQFLIDEKLARALGAGWGTGGAAGARGRTRAVAWPLLFPGIARTHRDPGNVIEDQDEGEGEQKLKCLLGLRCQREKYLDEIFSVGGDR